MKIIPDGVRFALRRRLILFYRLEIHPRILQELKDADGFKYFLADHLGSVSLVLDDQGTILEQQRYLPFGEPRTMAPYADVTSTDFTYTGQRALPDTGLMDYRARFYSPSLKRFIQPDTIIPGATFSQTWNRYSYVLNNPINASDPSGHKCVGEADECLKPDGKKGGGFTGGSTSNNNGGGNSSGNSKKKNDKPPSCPIHQAFCVGWDWLTEQGDGSSVEDPMDFGPNDQMVQDLMNSEEFKEQAWQAFLDSGRITDYYGVQANFEAYFKGFIFKATWTDTYLGGYVAYIENNGDMTATVTIRNTTGLASLTHNPESNYHNPSIESIVGNLNNSPFSYMPKRLPTSFKDLMYNYSPSSIFTDRTRNEPGLGGNMYQRFTWTQPIP